MTKMLFEWVQEAVTAIPNFLSLIKGKNVPGFYRYSLSGDMYGESPNWGLGNAVFAVKILYMLNQLSNKDKLDFFAFIKAFQDRKGFIYDPLVHRLSFFDRIYMTARHLDFNNTLGQQTKRAETRQAFAALLCLGMPPDRPFLQIPYDDQSIKAYIQALNWRRPWAASSHVSHLAFFLHSNRTLFPISHSHADSLLDTVFRILAVYRQKDGSWYEPGHRLPDYEKVNSAMKIMTAHDAAGRSDFDDPDRLIDLCLSAAQGGHACNHLNVICVLYHCTRLTDHRIEEIKEYCLQRLKFYQSHYWPAYGGFSFLEGVTGQYYYGAKISKGKPEPDIHGTVLFLWGIALIGKILGIDSMPRLRLPIT